MMIKPAHYIATAVLLLLAFTLVSTAHLSKPLRLQQAQQAHWQTLQNLLPESMQNPDITFETLKLMQQDSSETTFYYVAKQNNAAIARIIPVRRQGFVAAIESWVVIDQQGRVVGVHIAEHKESASLIGDHLDMHSPWLEGFKGLSIENNIPSIDHITQATISTRAVIQSVQQALRVAQEQQNSLNEQNPHE